MIEKKKINQFEDRAERVLLVGISGPQINRWDAEDHLRELQALAETAGTEVIETVIQERDKPDAATFIGKGKVEEVRLLAEELEIDSIIFDDELSPAQVRNLQTAIDTKVIDRSALILDIFASHAQSMEAKTQVELAQLNYLLPRLTRQWSHLSRQVGGVFTKGPGETQLETDRRLVRTRIASLKHKLEKIDQQRITQRQQRGDLFRAALIGYTNAGKSTLMKALTKADVLIEDKLFATLDTTVRRLQLNTEQAILISDTVGFIRKLPHHLIASFRTTLAETLEADLLIHVVDSTHPHLAEHIHVVSDLVSSLSTETFRAMLVFNKIDMLKDKHTVELLHAEYPHAQFISAQRNVGLAQLKQNIIEIIDQSYRIREIRLKFSKGAAEHLFYNLGQVLERHFDEEYCYLKIKFALANQAKIEELAARYA